MRLLVCTSACTPNDDPTSGGSSLRTDLTLVLANKQQQRRRPRGDPQTPAALYVPGAGSASTGGGGDHTPEQRKDPEERSCRPIVKSTILDLSDPRASVGVGEAQLRR